MLVYSGDKMIQCSVINHATTLWKDISITYKNQTYCDSVITFLNIYQREIKAYCHKILCESAQNTLS